MSLAQIGEFSFIIAGVGLALGATRHFLYPVAVAVSALTTLLTPWLIRASDSVASRIDDWLPHPLQTHAALYASWVGQLRSTPQHLTAWANIRRLVGLLSLDIAIIAVIVVGASLGRHRILALLDQRTFLDLAVGRWVLLGATLLVLLPFGLGAVRIARALGLALAAEALPGSGAALDLAAAPRRALLVSLQMAILIIAGIPLVAVTQPFLPSFPAITVLLLGMLALVVPLWRSASNLQGHVRAGAQVILEALASQSAVQPAPRASNSISQWRLDLGKLVPGLGDATTVRLSGQSAAVGRSLKEINLRGETGATVIAIHRPQKGVLYPTADEVLQDSDTLVLTGTEDSVASATRMLHQGETAAAAEGTTI
jgi:CPA2 family monovalent cation:H+ antiporter-2